MLYILLIIIAMGVLLISEPGRWLLKALFVLALIAAGLFLAFLLVMFAIEFLSAEAREKIFAVMIVFVILVCIGYAGQLFQEKYQPGEFRKDIIKKTKQLWHFIKNKVKRLWTVFSLLLKIYVALAILIVLVILIMLIFI